MFLHKIAQNYYLPMIWKFFVLSTVKLMPIYCNQIQTNCLNGARPTLSLLTLVNVKSWHLLVLVRFLFLTVPSTVYRSLDHWAQLMESSSIRGLIFDSHINNIEIKADKMLGFIIRNRKDFNRQRHIIIYTLLSSTSRLWIWIIYLVSI